MKLGVCQMAVSENLGVNTKKIISFIKEAALQDINIVGFPEMALTGYTKEILADENLNNMVQDSLSEIKKPASSIIQPCWWAIPTRLAKNFTTVPLFLPDGSTFTYDKNIPRNWSRNILKRAKRSH